VFNKINNIQYFTSASSIFSHASAQNDLYLDSAVTSQKLHSVIDITQQHYKARTVNVHRSGHELTDSVKE
jgi:selenocysteine lyase/cysteine desulfurase